MVYEVSEREFRVVTRQNWIAEHFSVVGGVHDFGFDVDPHTAPDTVWWASGGWAASVSKLGVKLPLLSCGTSWMDTVPHRYTRRRIVTVPAAQAGDAAREWKLARVFLKLPEAKTDAFPAHVCDTWRIDDEIIDVSQDICGDLFSHTLVQVSEALCTPPWLEARFFISDDHISHGSVYRLGNSIWGSGSLDLLLNTSLNAEQVSGHLSTMRKFIAELLADTDHPRGFVVDVGIMEGGTPILVEANAAWSSNPYSTPPEDAHASIEASHDFDGSQSRWLFNTAQVPRPHPRVQMSRKSV